MHTLLVMVDINEIKIYMVKLNDFIKWIQKNKSLKPAVFSCGLFQYEIDSS